MSKFVTLVLEPRFNDEYGEYTNLPVFNAHGDVVGYTGGEVPETGNPCEFYVMDEEGFPVCHSASENAKLTVKFNAERLDAENASLHIRLQSAYATIERQKLSILDQRRQLAATQKALEERNAGVLKSRWRRSLAMWAERCAGLEKELAACKTAIRTFVDEYESMAEVEGPCIDCLSCEACGYDGDCVVMDALDDLKRLGAGADE